MLLQRGLAFAQSADALLEVLLRELLRDVEGLLEGQCVETYQVAT
ncbi:hypothetical protein CCP3SC1_630008 [Gammaproteobacteria bacterium]